MMIKQSSGPSPLGIILTVGTGIAVATATAALIEILKLKNRWPGLTDQAEKPDPDKDPVVSAGKGL